MPVHKTLSISQTNRPTMDVCHHRQHSYAQPNLLLARKADKCYHLPVSVDKTGIDVVRPLHSPDGLKADPRGLVWHDVDKAILEFVAWEVGAYEPGRVGFGVGKSLKENKNRLE